ncbi:recombinase RecT [Clostridium tetani]|uniref:recombinase RecT n=1 Tax=Clostridium tetani TaxID=1513 RepID=UPI00100A2A6C|nr:recombinase RecT [Clostridium tetani]RXI38693.1 recombinase RecT [Clostridium tetani]
MATNESLKNQLSTKKETGLGSVGNTIKGLMNSPAIKKRFEEVLKQRAPQYMSSIVNLVNSDINLKKCDQMSVVASCMVAATLDLPVDKNLGYAWVVPYGNKAQFQLGYKGYVQLALRTGQYKSINVIEIHEGELIDWNPLTEELKIDFSKKESDAVIGYAGYFELLNGFKKSTYWTKEQITKHKNKFSKSDFGWKKDFDAMARKTVLRNMLSKWGILSIEMQNAYTADQRIIKNEIMETGEVKENIEYIEADFESYEDNSIEEGGANE